MDPLRWVPCGARASPRAAPRACRERFPRPAAWELKARGWGNAAWCSAPCTAPRLLVFAPRAQGSPTSNSGKDKLEIFGSLSGSSPGWVEQGQGKEAPSAEGSARAPPSAGWTPASARRAAAEAHAGRFFQSSPSESARPTHGSRGQRGGAGGTSRGCWP